MAGDITYRPPDRADAAEWFALTRAVIEHAGAEFRETFAHFDREFDNPAWNPATDGLLAHADGRLVGATYVVAPPEGGAIVRGSGMTHPQTRGRGIGTTLTEWTLRRAQVMRADRAASALWSLHHGVINDEADSIALLTDQGFSLARTIFGMRRALTGPVEPRPLPAGLGQRPYSADLDHPLYATYVESFSDHWGFQRRGYDAWQRRTADPCFRPDLTRLAVTAEGDVAGFVYCTVGADPTKVELDLIGTRRAWRGRGVASALIASTLEAARAGGFTAAGLGVDSINPTGALSVYERAGFCRNEQFAVYSRPIG